MSHLVAIRTWAAPAAWEAMVGGIAAAEAAKRCRIPDTGEKMGGRRWLRSRGGERPLDVDGEDYGKRQNGPVRVHHRGPLHDMVASLDDIITPPPLCLA